MANRLAKKNKEKSGCIAVLDTPGRIAYALQKTSVHDIWGIGRKYAIKLENQGIYTAYDLQLMNEDWAYKYLGGVVGTRLLNELKGNSSIMMRDPLSTKKNIATTRMFGTPVTSLNDIKEAIATYVSIAANKLRRQNSAAVGISVFVVVKVPRDEKGYHHGETISNYCMLNHATSCTNELIKVALHLTETIYKPEFAYKKAGVMLSGLVPDTSIQANLFVPAAINNNRMLMNAIDNINAAMRDDKVKFAAAGVAKNWKMRQEMRSPRYTTRWEEICEVK